MMIIPSLRSMFVVVLSSCTSKGMKHNQSIRFMSTLPNKLIHSQIILINLKLSQSTKWRVAVPSYIVSIPHKNMYCIYIYMNVCVCIVIWIFETELNTRLINPLETRTTKHTNISIQSKRNSESKRLAIVFMD